MKRVVLVLTVVFFLAGTAANAQMHQSKSKKSGQQQGMMMGNKMCPMHEKMMGSQQMPMQKYRMKIRMLPNMQEKLSLSTEQVEQLIDMQSTFKKQQIDYKADLNKKKMKLHDLLKDDASASDLKNQMQAMASTKIDMKVAAYETANEMKSVLTDEQKEKMKNMMKEHYGDMMKSKSGKKKK